MKERFTELKRHMLEGPYVVYLYALVAIGITVHALNVPARPIGGVGPAYAIYNNFSIFRSAALHLIDGRALYAIYPAEHWDIYKYTPAFAWLFIPIAFVPVWAGLFAWNSLNIMVPALGVLALKMLDRRERSLFLLLILPECIIALQNSQSNGLIAGLLIWTFVHLERGNPGTAAALVILAAFIKPFALAAGMLFLLYPFSWRSVLSTAGVVLFLLIGPWSVRSPSLLVADYGAWLEVLRSDHAVKHGYSVMGWLSTWFNWQPSKSMVVCVGIALLLIPALYRSASKSLHFRSLSFAFLMIWVVIFNHMAESPTFIIAIIGVTLWFIRTPRARWTTALMVLTFVLSSLTPTDLFPRVLLNELVKPYVLKVLPYVLVASVLWWQMMRMVSTGMTPAYGQSPSGDDPRRLG